MLNSSVTLALTVTDAQNGYSFDAPQGWQKLTVPDMVTTYTDGVKRFTISVSVQPGPKVVKLEGAVKTAFLDTSFVNLKAAAIERGATSVTRKNTTLGGQPALDAQCTIKGNTFEMLFTAANEKAYVLVLKAGKADFAKQQALFDKVKSSFKFSQ